MNALSATFHLTHHCNLRCTYCYTGEKRPLAMSYDTIDQSIAFIEKELAQRQAEMKALFEQYAWNKLKDLPRQERDSLNRLQREERKAIEAKYEAMELLTDEEKAAYQLKFNAFNEREQAWQRACAEDIRLNTLRKLEEQVRMYIKWARSQMGE